MSNFLAQYEAVLNCAVEAANAYLDMEGGSFILALTSELIQGLVEAGDHEGAILVIRQVCEAANVECDWVRQEECGKDDTRIWPSLFSEILTEHLEVVGK